MNPTQPLTHDQRPLLSDLLQNAYRFPADMAFAASERVPLDETLAIMHGGRIASFLRIVPYQVYLGGKPVTMGGISTVATWADLQGRGYARRLLHHALVAMHERGIATSMLYPFSHSFYRRLGYESAHPRIICGPFQKSNLRAPGHSPDVRIVRSLAEWQSVENAYREFAICYNGMVARTEKQWHDRWDLIMRKRGQIYAAYENDIPVGYFTTEYPDGAMPPIPCHIREFVAANDRVAHELFGFISRLPTNVGEITLHLPSWPDYLENFIEPTIQRRAQQYFMVRIVDIASAFSPRSIPAGINGELVISVQDESAPWNTGTWRIGFNNGTLSAEPSKQTASLHFTIQQLSQVFFGVRNPVIDQLRGINYGANLPALQMLAAAFCERSSYLLDEF